MKVPTILKKLKLNSVDFVRRGANPAADIALYKSADYNPDETEYMDVAKAEQDLTLFTDILGESFSSIMKDDSLNQDDKLNMIAKSVSEFTDTLDDYLSSFSILEKSDYEEPKWVPQTADVTEKSSITRKGVETMSENYMNVDKSLLTADEAATLDALIAKACKTKKMDNEGYDFKAGKVNPAKAQEEEEDNADLPPAVKKALEEVERLTKSYEMREMEAVAKKYEVLGKKASEEAKTLYDLKKSGENNYKAYIAAMDAQVDLVEKSGLFAEIGKSGNYNYSPVAKSEPETKIETIAKSYMESDPALTYTDAVAKAWANNPELMAEYEQTAGF